MKKSNKVSIIYVISSISLLLVLIFGGVYGIYISVGLNFVKSTVSNITGGASNVSNVAYGANPNVGSSMTGVIILSIALIVLAIFDIISLIKQVVFFKQFKVVENSKLEHMVEKKVKSKGAVIFLASTIDILSLIIGVVGIFMNARSFVGNNISWILYVVDGAVCVLAVMSFVLLLVKLKKVKKIQEENKKFIEKNEDEESKKCKHEWFDLPITKFDIDKIEYCLIKLKYLKSSKIISADEYELLRNSLFKKRDEEKEVELTAKKNKG